MGFEYIAGGGGGDEEPGVTDHGALTGLADDDHPQYATDTDLSTHAAAANPHSVYALDTDLSTHEADTTAIHGIADTSALATSSSVTSAVSTHTANTDAHHAKSHAHSGADGSGTVAHSATTGKTADDHHAQAHSISGADHTGTLAHSSLSSVSANQHHNQSHTDTDHSDGPNVKAFGGGKDTVQAHGATGSTETIDLASGNVHSITLDAACTLTFTGSTASVACSFTLIVTQDGTGSRLITWPASVKWPGGSAVVLSTGINKVDVLTFVTVDNGTTWLGFTSGLDLR